MAGSTVESRTHSSIMSPGFLSSAALYNQISEVMFQLCQLIFFRLFTVFKEASVPAIQEVLKPKHVRER